jgi:tetratricopeptide (TPR) repeat protein
MELTLDEALQKAVEAHKTGQIQEAERFYTIILQSQPKHPDANHNLGLLAVSVNKADVALPLFKTALEANPKIEQFWLSYIDALIKEKQFDIAKQVLEQAKKQGISGEKLNIPEAQLSSETQIQKVISVSPSQAQLSSLLEYYQNGQYGDAQKLAEYITQEFPKCQFGWTVLSAVLKQTGRVSESLIASQKSVQLAPQDPIAHYNLGVTLKELDRLDEAEASYRQAIVLKPDFSKACSNLGITLQELGRLDEAEASLRQAIALEPDFFEAHYNLGVTLKELDRLDEAEASYRQAMVLKPDYAKAYSNLGITLQELGRLDEAEPNLRQAIALKPDFFEAHYNLGVTLKELGRLDGAEASYRQAIVLKPDYAEAHSNLGITLKELGRLNESEASYRQAISLKPDYAEAHNNLGIILKELGRFDESIEYLKQAIELNPNFVEAKMNLNSVASSAVPGWHLSMMNDEVRNNAYSDALKLAVSDGDFVLDIGTGSGLLSLMAAASGAEKVITCETSRTIAEAAKEIIDSNGYKGKISVLNKKSTNLIFGVDLPQQADLIISEVLSSEFVGEGVRATILDANKRLLKKGGRMIPQSGKIKIALIDNSPEIFNSTSVASVHGFDLSQFNSISQKKFNLKLRDKPLLLSDPKDAFNINLYDSSEVVGEEKIIELRVNQDGLCVGLIQWIWIHLYKEIEYENKPGESDSHWTTPIYLFDEPVVAKKGDAFEIKAVLGEDYVWFCKLV